MILLAMVATCGLFSSCGDDDWSNNNPAMEHIYYYGLGNVKYPGGNELQYNVEQGEIVEVPTYFFSAYKRSYSPVVNYYTSAVPQNKENTEPQLVCGTDYSPDSRCQRRLQHDVAQCVARQSTCFHQGLEWKEGKTACTNL